MRECVRGCVNVLLCPRVIVCVWNSCISANDDEWGDKQGEDENCGKWNANVKWNGNVLCCVVCSGVVCCEFLCLLHCIFDAAVIVLRRSVHASSSCEKFSAAVVLLLMMDTRADERIVGARQISLFFYFLVTHFKE